MSRVRDSMSDGTEPWMGKLLGILGSDGDSKTLGIAIVNATTLGEFNICYVANHVVAAVGTEVCHHVVRC